MKATNRTNTKAEDSGYLGHFEQTDWTTVYDGNITIEGVGHVPPRDSEYQSAKLAAGLDSGQWSEYYRLSQLQQARAT